ncbi:MAG: glutaredoxin 3 [Pseudomonadota bacterium]
MKPIDIYTTPICPYCIRAKRLLSSKGLDFNEINVMGNAAKRAEMTERAQGGRTVPQIFIGDVHVGGSDELMELEQSGRLDPLLAA